jgi:hypothetical protein
MWVWSSNGTDFTLGRAAGGTDVLSPVASPWVDDGGGTAAPESERRLLINI